MKIKTVNKIANILAEVTTREALDGMKTSASYLQNLGVYEQITAVVNEVASTLSPREKSVFYAYVYFYEAQKTFRGVKRDSSQIELFINGRARDGRVIVPSLRQRVERYFELFDAYVRGKEENSGGLSDDDSGRPMDAPSVVNSAVLSKFPASIAALVNAIATKEGQTVVGEANSSMNRNGYYINGLHGITVEQYFKEFIRAFREAGVNITENYLNSLTEYGLDRQISQLFVQRIRQLNSQQNLQGTETTDSDYIRRRQSSTSGDRTGVA